MTLRAFCLQTFVLRQKAPWNTIFLHFTRITNDNQSIKVSCQIGERTTIYTVECAKDSLGRIIGAKGKNITSLRNIIAAMMAANGIHAIIEIPYYKMKAKIF